MNRILKTIFILLLSTASYAQGYVDQKAMAPISASQKTSTDSLQKTTWHTIRYNGVWNDLLRYTDSLPGNMQKGRYMVIQLANRITGDNMKAGRELVIPDSFPEDYKAYSPYPFVYQTALGLPKLFIIDKYTQTFGAYEYGKLVHWGLVSTGRKTNLTPAGRYNFNWKTPYRKSTAAPPGEVWEMYWVFDFHAKFGIHVHQYSLPIGAAASHGCVRTAEPDAVWNYNWANGWVRNNKGIITRNGTPVMVINNNPPTRPTHWKVENGEILSQVHLPATFNEVRLGTLVQQQAAWESGW